MDARTAAPSDRVYEDFNPSTIWNHRDEADTFVVYVPDFNKENLRVQLTASKTLKISGQRPIGGNRWKRFLREEEIPANCDTTRISAKFQDGGLQIIMPKLVPPPVKHETPAVVEAPRPPAVLATVDQPPQRPAVSLPPTQQEKSNSQAGTNEKPGNASEIQAGGEVPPLPKIAEKENEEEEQEEEEEKNGRKEDDTSNAEAVHQLKESMSMVSLSSRKSPVGFFNKLKNPRNLQKMVAMVVLGTLAGLFIISMLKWCKCENKDL